MAERTDGYIGALLGGLVAIAAVAFLLSGGEWGGKKKVEGDLGNARYWYRQAGRSPATGALDAEWEAIVRALI